uniref:Telomerase reverse transcriptase n=1 Tax=Ciona savignyi TaxID=51511 RepID=A5HE93_CIOSA|nr:telomerase reverse transcriptase [Ciona savignyi]
MNLNIYVHTILYSKVSFNDKTNEEIFPRCHVLRKLSVSNTSARKLVQHIFKDIISESRTSVDKIIKKPAISQNLQLQKTSAVNTTNFTDTSATLFEKTFAGFGFETKVKKKHVAFNGCNKLCKASSTYKENLSKFQLAFTPDKIRIISEPEVFKTSKDKLNILRRLRKCIPLCYNLLKKTNNRTIFNKLTYYTKFKSSGERSLTKQDLHQLSKLPVTQLTEHLSKMLQLYTTKHQVYLFLRASLKKTIPIHLMWGTKRNQTAFHKNLKQFLGCRRYDKFSILDFTKGLCIEDLPWVKGIYGKDTLLQFFKWIIEEYLFVLIRGSFYITDNGNFKNRLFFYPKKIWSEAVAYGVALLLKQKRWAFHSSEKHTVPPYFAVRFCPKLNGLRPIMKLRNPKEPSSKMSFNSISSVLKLALQRFPDSLGFAIKDRSDIYCKWRQFLLKLKEINAKRWQLYFVKLDICRCFDSIPIPKLLRIVQDLLDRAGTLDVSIVTKGKLRCKIHHCSQYIVDQLKFFLRDVTLSVLSKTFIKLNGIPQGWLLSSLLCNIFYGHMEQTHLFKVFEGINHEPCLLLRYVDDYLFITTNQDKATTFLQLMHSGFEDYGCKINPKKTCINFHPNFIDSQVLILNNEEPFHWFGYIFPTCINMNKKQIKQTGTNNFGGISMDLSSYQSTRRYRDFMSTRSSVTIYRQCSIQKNMTRRVDHMLFDPQITCRKRIFRNLYEIALLGAIHTVAYDLHRKDIYKDPLIINIFINLVAHRVWVIIQRKFKGKHFLSNSLVKWIFFKAFLVKLKRHHYYKKVIPSLHRQVLLNTTRLQNSKKWRENRFKMREALINFPVTLCKLKT